jgi:hypothetical protein
MLARPGAIVRQNQALSLVNNSVNAFLPAACAAPRDSK